MLKIGVMGLGNIAQKAYLPTMAGMQDEYEWHLTTRNEKKGKALAARYGFTHLHQTLDELIAVHPAAVFVHTPTATHPAIIRALLNAGIHVYVDKPVATDPAVVRDLYGLAASKNLLLTCGFNRRFAPFSLALKAMPDKQQITAEKTRVHAQQESAAALWDLMIHPLDTALWLADGDAATTAVHVRSDHAGNLQQAYYTADTGECRVSAVTNMDAAANLEEVTVQAVGGRKRSIDLLQLQTQTSAGSLLQHRPDWEKVLETRGFAPLTRAFLDAVSGKGPNPVSPESAIASHEACAELVAALQ